MRQIPCKMYGSICKLLHIPCTMRGSNSKTRYILHKPRGSLNTFSSVLGVFPNVKTGSESEVFSNGIQSFFQVYPAKDKPQTGTDLPCCQLPLAKRRLKEQRPLFHFIPLCSTFSNFAQDSRMHFLDLFMFSTLTTESWALVAGLNRSGHEAPETLDGDLAVESGCNLAVEIPSAAVHSAQGFG